MKEVIKINNLSFQYRKSEPHVLKNINVSIKPNEWVSIVGHNGSGKSTLAKFMNALFYPIDQGDVLINGINTREEETHQDIRKNVAMVFQNPDNQIVAPTVEDDVAFGLENAGVPHEEMVKIVQESIDIMNLTGLERKEPHHLSGGQKQRVALAGALALRPSILVLDEATSMLDPVGRKEVLQHVQKLRKKKDMTLITITHDLNEAILADRMLVMKQGEIIADGQPLEIVQNQELLESANLTQPFFIKVIHALKNNGVELPNSFTSELELVDYLWKLKQKI
ncbi:energy-coupling factor transporter ATPase [Evansella sp. AB-rgal1]|uniref:energy-coupling factor transporter ATPase n=1 Tax=Evansella sp. AB-rgal1 TaxID=3242696 RepID=UPI00359EFBED